MIYKEIYNSVQLQEEFKSFDRDYYSPAAYDAMFEYMSETGEDYCLDVIDLCCRFAEYNEDELTNDYGTDFKNYVDNCGYVEDYCTDNDLDMDKMTVEDFDDVYNILYAEYEDEWRENILNEIPVDVILLYNGDYLVIE